MPVSFRGGGYILYAYIWLWNNKSKKLLVLKYNPKPSIIYYTIFVLHSILPFTYLKMQLLSNFFMRKGPGGQKTHKYCLDFIY